MRAFLLSIVCSFLLLATIASAWSWQPHALMLAGDDQLDKRAETTDASTTEATASASETSTETDTAKDKDKEKATKTDTKTDKKTTATSSISIDPAAGAGGVAMITPASSSTSYYKIGHNVTFVWNYTSLSVTPSAVNVVASCSLNSATYTITSNMSAKATGSVVWDTNNFEASATMKLLTATYTLVIYDAAKEIDDTAKAGHLSSQSQFYFGMYRPQKYTPLNEFKCATCSGAISDIDRQAFKFALGMAIITIASFTWFAGSFGFLSM
ncbi:hypothetical protein NUU61_005481 [Penicillium alfredii]|uniref:DUF7137 domain-containing protein n=1 Tax=Penicillium alfredii TaxID=1506179 RepID=A0A9W9F9H1_9EURO|nr:uncharacterized protein NUU61_005481 [Penicillium alfredii]KAJ5096125.1 hypothetical protein NUU61_005481 [Penicillium alfredii]